MARKVLLASAWLLACSVSLAEEVIIRSISQDILLDYLAGKEVFSLIDARSPAEYEAGHIHNAINVPHDAELAASVLPRDKDAPLVVYCKSGIRAVKLRDRMLEAGYRNVRVLGPAQMMWAGELPVFNCGVEPPETQVLETADTGKGLADGLH